VVLTRRDSELAGVERPSFELLDAFDMVAWTSRWEIQDELEAAWRRRRNTPRVVYRTDDNLALQRLVTERASDTRASGRFAAERAIDPSLTWLAPGDILTPRTVTVCHPAGATSPKRYGR
jgi:hypothetical protein